MLEQQNTISEAVRVYKVAETTYTVVRQITTAVPTPLASSL
jgi:hypothetical protein